MTDNTFKLPAPGALAVRVSDVLGPSGAAPQPPQAEQKSQREWLLLVIWRQKWLILGTVIACLIGAAMYLQVKTPIFTGTSRISVAPAARFSMQNQPGGAAQGNEKFLFTQVEFLTSEPVLTIASVMDPVARSATLKNVPPDRIVRYLKEEVVTANVDKNNDIISVTARSTDSVEAADIANSVVNAYMAYQRKPKSGTSGQQLENIKTSKTQVGEELQARMADRKSMEVKYGILSSKDEGQNVSLRALQTLQDKVVESHNETIRAESDYREAVRKFGRRAPEIEKTLQDMDDYPSSPQEQSVLRAEMMQAQAQLQELQARYLPEHPSIQTMQRRLDRLNIAYLNAIYRRFVTDQRYEKDLHDSYEEEKKKVIELSAHTAEYVRLGEEIDRLKRRLDSLDDAIRDTTLGRETGDLSIDVIDKASPEARPSLPSKRMTLAVAIGVGLICGLMLSCMREWVDDRFAGASDIKSSLGMPVLAVIPQTPTKRSPSVSGQRILLDPSSDAAEAYRSLRTAVQFSAPAGQLKTLLITSPTSGDGKTTLVSNLAIAMAQAGKRTIVVDVDLRKPMQHEIFGCKNNTGLSALLAGRCSVESAVQRTGVQNLEILPCGPVPANPAEILNSREFGEMLEQLADKYDYVLLDSPPVEAVADARIVAASCDATLLVLKAQTAHRRQAEHTRDGLLSVGARIIGVVVNDLPRRPQGAYGQSNGNNKRVVAGLTSQEYDLLQTRPK